MSNSTNEVIINGQGVMSVRGDTVTENTLAQGETATNKKGEKITGTLNTESKEDISSLNDKIDSLSNTAYMINDDEGEITEADYIPFYDVSDEDNPKKKVVLGELSQRIGESIGVYSPHTYDMGTAIPENDDLNDYISEGVFYVSSISVAETIANIPVSIAGKLIVMNRDTGARLFQIYIASENDIYIRGMDDNYVFNEWRNIAKSHTYELGTDIPANSDLNTYTREGVYRIAPDATAITVTNIPQGIAGKLIVVKGVVSDANVDEYKEQFYLTYTGSIYKRYTTNSGTSWSEWTTIVWAYPKTYNSVNGISFDSRTENGARAIFQFGKDGNRVRQSWYDGTKWSGERVMANLEDISPAGVGNGYAVATVSGSTITATISGFQLRAGVIVALRVTTRVTTDCTLNISNTGAKSVKYWNDETVSVGKEISYGTYTFIYDGTYYRVLGHEHTPIIGAQGYVADTSGNLTITWGYGVNKAQIKYNLLHGVLVWNYYKNSAWRGDKVILDAMGGQTMEGWLGLKGGAGRTIASGAHSMGVQDTIPNIINELRYSNGAWGSFNLGTAYTLNQTTIPTGWYNYFYIPHRVGGENWATPTTWDSDNVQYGTLLLFGMNNSNGMFRLRWANGSVLELEDMQKGNCYVGTCTTAGGTKDKEATVDGNFVLRKGVRVAIKFSNTNTYSSSTANPVTLNVNDTGAKNIWFNTNHSGAGNTGTYITPYGVANRYNFYIYDGTYWVWDSHGNDNNDVDPRVLGFGYGTCATAEATTAKVVTLASYTLRTGGFVAVKFTYAVPANSTMNINSRGAKEIWHRGAKITANKIKAGDLATFVYDGTRYQLVANDRYIT